MKGKPLQEIQPTEALLVCSQNCEEKAAHIHNETVRAIKKGNISTVKDRYRQSKAGEKNSRELANGSLATALFCLISAYYSFIHQDPRIHRNTDLLFLPLGTIAVCVFLYYWPNRSNTATYKTTKQMAKQFLIYKIGGEEFNKYKKLISNPEESHRTR
jgi:hypothetical protein